MYARAKSGSPIKVAAISLPSLVRLNICVDQAATIAINGEHLTVTFYQFVRYSHDWLVASGLYRKTGFLNFSKKNMAGTLEKLFDLYPGLELAQFA